MSPQPTPNHQMQITAEVEAAGRVFRAILDAMAHPGRIATITGGAEPSPQAPSPLANPATTALCRAMLDAETPVWLDAACRTPAAMEFLRFQCACPIIDAPAGAAFALCRGPQIGLDCLDRGTDAYPERSTTVLIAVDDLAEDGPLVLTGPGIQDQHRLAVAGIDADLWADRAAVNADFPRGIDLVFTAGDRLCALPRTTRVSLDGEPDTCM